MAGLIHLPPIQNYIGERLTTYLTKGTGYTTELDYINIRWFNAVSIDGLHVYDQAEEEMIGIEEVVLTFRLPELIGKKDIQTKEAWVLGADVNLRTLNDSSPTLNIDDWANKIAEVTQQENPDPNFEPAAFSVDQISLKDSRFSLSDARKDSISEGLDYNHFQLIDVEGDLLNLVAVADTFQVDVKYLTVQDSASGFKIDKLETFFRNSRNGMSFYDIDLQVGETRITNEVVFNHDRPSQMGSFVDSVYVEVNFEGTTLDTKTLSYFAPELKAYDEKIRVEGFFEGTVRDFFSDNFQIDFGDRSSLKGQLEIEGLPDVNQTLFDVSLTDSFLDVKDVEKYIKAESYGIIEKFGLIGLNAQFDGLVDDFVSDGEFNTSIGDFTTNTQITVYDGQLPSYNGSLQMNRFELGLFTDIPAFGLIDLDGNINGKGFRLEDAAFNLDAIISQVVINEYNFIDIETDGNFAESFFEGQLRVEDPNLRLFSSGSIDLREESRLFNISGRLDTARLDLINLADNEISLATTFNVDFTGLKLDSLLGQIELTDTYFAYLDKDINFDSLSLNSSRVGKNRSLEFISEAAIGKLEGDFEFSTLIDELQNINEQYRLVFSSQSDAVNEYLANNPPSKEKFRISYSLALPEISPFLQLFDSTLYFAKNTTIQGRFSNEKSEDFSLIFDSDTVQFANLKLLNNDLVLNANSLRKADDLLTLGYLYSEKQYFGSSTETNNLTFEGVWDGKHIDIMQTLGQESTGNYAELGAAIDFYPNRTELKFEDSNFLALGEEWLISEENIVVFGEKRIDIKNLNIFNKDQSVSFNGEVAVLKDSAQTLGIEFKGVQVANLNTFTREEYTGTLNGSLKAQNLYFNPILFGNLSMRELKINNFLVGDLTGDLNWNDLSRRFDLDFKVNRLGKEIIDLNGEFYPRAKEQLDLNLRLNEANLNISEPYINDYFSEIDGVISGSYRITGNMKEPVMVGNGLLTNGAMKINYLNTSYEFNGAVNLRENLIDLKEMTLSDAFNHEASLNGEITHDYFKDFSLNIGGDLNGLQVLNTTENLSDLYYGSAFATGTINLIGEASNLTIAANARTEPNTTLYIPITEGVDDLDTPEYITFIDRTDSTNVEQAQAEDFIDKIEIIGLNLDLDIEVTPDAYVEIIIDAKSGDIIRGRADGQLRLEIDTQGDFDMTGEIDIIEGAYNFSLYNIITKEFQIEQPSSITWYGDPYEGIMNINGSYAQNTSLQPILDQSGFGSINDGNGSINRRFPTKVLLALTGPMLSPEIGFDIDFSDIQGQENQVAINAFKNRIQSDEQELNRQVLSLIVLNRFSDQGGLNIGGRTTTQNVSQLLSNQLSQLIAQLDENLEVDFDLADLDQNAFNTFQLRLSYTFLDGRLRVTREGGLTNLVDINSIAGDWTAEYLLTEDGRYKVKVYSRNTFDLTNRTIAQNASINTTGASLTQTTSFNTFKEFFSGVNRKRRQRAKAETNSDN